MVSIPIGIVSIPIGIEYLATGIYQKTADNAMILESVEFSPKKSFQTLYDLNKIFVRF